MNERPVPGDRTDRTATDVVRLQDRVNVLEVQVKALDLDRRRARAFGPALLLVVATFTPLVAVTPRNDSQETFTLWQAVRGGTATGGVSQTWFVLIAAIMVVTAGVGFVLLERQPSRRMLLLVRVTATVLIVALILTVIFLAGQGSKSTAVSGMHPATVLATLAACWLLVSSTSARD